MDPMLRDVLIDIFASAPGVGFLALLFHREIKNLKARMESAERKLIRLCMNAGEEATGQHDIPTSRDL